MPKQRFWLLQQRQKEKMFNLIYMKSYAPTYDGIEMFYKTDLRKGLIQARSPKGGILDEESRNLGTDVEYLFDIQTQQLSNKIDDEIINETICFYIVASYHSFTKSYKNAFLYSFVLPTFSSIKKPCSVKVLRYLLAVLRVMLSFSRKYSFLV